VGYSLSEWVGVVTGKGEANRGRSEANERAVMHVAVNSMQTKTKTDRKVLTGGSEISCQGSDLFESVCPIIDYLEPCGALPNRSP